MILFDETEGAFIHKHEKYLRTSCSTFVNAEWRRNAVTFKWGVRRGRARANAWSRTRYTSMCM